MKNDSIQHDHGFQNCIMEFTLVLVVFACLGRKWMLTAQFDMIEWKARLYFLNNNMNSEKKRTLKGHPNITFFSTF